MTIPAQTDLLMERGAVLSPDGVYRYRLWRAWDRRIARVAFIMLNPSTADADVDDPTIRRCLGFARYWGFGGIDVVNLYAFRATDPRDLAKAPNPVGSDNEGHLDVVTRTAGLVVAAWGSHAMAAKAAPRVERLVTRIRDLHAIEMGMSGAPKHPLYLRADIKPALYRAKEPAP